MVVDVVTAPLVHARHRGISTANAYVYASNRSGDFDLYWHVPGAAQPTQLTSSPLDDVQPDVSRVGGRIVFVRGDGITANPAAGRIMIRERTGEERPLFADPSIQGFSPAWSPTGDRVAFARTLPTCPLQTCVDGQSAVWIVNADGTGLRQVTPVGAAGWANYPTWSPDGAFVAYGASHSGGTHIWIVDADPADGTVPARRLTQANANTAPDWSPDGSWVLFNASTPAGTQLHAIRPDGTGEYALTSGRGPNIFGSWSPDGTRVLLSSGSDFECMGLPNALCRREIYVMRAGGSEALRLTQDGVIATHPVWWDGSTTRYSPTAGDERNGRTRGRGR